MNLLVAAQEIRLDTTSEGICTAKFISALVDGGHTVTCLTPDRLDEPGRCAWLPAVAIETLDGVQARGLWPSVARQTNRLTASGSMGANIDGKLNAAISLATGYTSHIWRKVSDWRQAIKRASRDVDVVITRAAGARFEPHFAMLGLTLDVPWVANYHDPYPISLYPEPYRERIRLRSAAQERLHLQILDRADALTFPSARLCDWVLGDRALSLRAKAFVVSHIGMDGAHLPRSAPADRLFRVVHTGTMLSQRNPRGLLRGFLDFLGRDPDRQARSRLVLIGRLDKQHLGLPEWQALERLGVLEKVEQRIPFEAAALASRLASAVAIVEADAETSPFFPAKLADYLSLRKPILALSPRASSTADILGPDYPLLVPPADHVAIARAFARLWEAWRTGQLDSLLPDEASIAAVSVSAVQKQTDTALEFARTARRRTRSSLSPSLPVIAARQP